MLNVLLIYLHLLRTEEPHVSNLHVIHFHRMFLAEPRKILFNLRTGGWSTNNYHLANVVMTIQISVLTYLSQSLGNTIKGVGGGFNFVDVAVIRG